MMKPHWYFITRWACVICAREEQMRKRRYGVKPADPALRYDDREEVCCDHFIC